jgi:ribonuclease E
MTSKMLIDSSHPEETRVVVTRGNRVEEFDFESALRKQLRGNIYLAKVTRVEPSLQAAFVDFGGNRHGFLAFSEIHPDYYQIPMADRQALLDDEARAARDEDEDEDGRGRRDRGRGRRRHERSRRGPRPETVSEAAPEGENGDGAADQGAEVRTEDVERAGEDAAAPGAEAGETSVVEAATDLTPIASVTEEPLDPAAPAEGDAGSRGEDHIEGASASDEGNQSAAAEGREEGENGDGDDANDEDGDEEGSAGEPEEVIEQIGGADALEEVPVRHQFRSRRQYKIQEVIKRRQILLVQVVKEERGNKGAALTTYLSLAGRYSVLMPNTARGGGISRKITNSTDRKRLKSIAQELEVPDGMGIILRTAGAARTKTEVKRDFEYLMRLWESVRELTLKSTAPTLVYEEGSLVKRAIRDLYTKEVEEIQVAGDEGYREAKDFMKMLMPSHAKMVKLYKEPQPLFARFGVEGQLDAMFNNIVQLRSGGYIVINQTEALVSIDVNSGRATREHNIEDTALKTNLEAAEEISRQLRLRDLAGLIVIDFIDMEEKRNNRAVERKINDCLKNDRARIQLGRISHFGLLEMSRQRIRTGVLESSTSPCPHCNGTGLKRGTASIALNLVRALEEALMKNASYDLIVRTPSEIALYVLNHKRDMLVALENRFGVHITFRTDETILPPHYHAFERGELSTRPVAPKTAISAASVAPVDETEEEVEEEVSEESSEEAEDAEEAIVEAEGESREDAGERADDGNGGRRRKRRRRRRGGRGPDGENGFNGPREADEAGAVPADEAAGDVDSERGEGENGGEGSADERQDGAGEGDRGNRRRRRRRGGRRHRRENGEGGYEPREAGGEGEQAGDPEDNDAPREPRRIEIATPELRDTTVGSMADQADGALPDVSVIQPEIAKGDEGPIPVRAPAATIESAPAPAEPAAPPAPVEIKVRVPESQLIEDEPADPNRPKKSGWWAKARKAVGG